ncbi:3-methyl-2-oxobutanoate hydroxymethyltransferase [soil metagenome]
MNKINLNYLQDLKQKSERFACLTAYDASFAQILSEVGVEVILIGDSLANVVQGHETTIPIRLKEMVYHTRCVSRGNCGALLIADLPFMTYATPTQALKSAAQLMQAGAHVVKLEGGAWLAETVHLLSERGIPVCGHLGLTPQSLHQLGGYRVQGRHPHHAEALLEDAIALQKAGARLIVLECIPSTLAAEITSNLSIPTIGIGAGPECDGQILVIYDLLGITPGYTPKFAKNFLIDQPIASIQEAVKAYINAVKEQRFPIAEQGF